MQRPLSEPKLQSTSQGQGYKQEGRWRWWYSAIADYMIRNPNGTMADCARVLGKHPNTISAIAKTDIFREFLAQRKAEFFAAHDHAVRTKLTQVAEASLDIVLGQLQKKGDQIPLARLESLTTSTLDRLGYGVKSPTVVVDNSQHDNRQQTLQFGGLTPQLLEEARAAMRAVERQKAGQSLPSPADLSLASAPQEVEAELDVNVSDVLDGEVSNAPVSDET